MRRLLYYIVLTGICFLGCKQKEQKPPKATECYMVPEKTSLIILGIAQDGGSPHAGCKKVCCKDLFITPDKTRLVVSLGVIDPENKKNYLFEATPDLSQQMKMLKEFSLFEAGETPSGIFLTHAHIGHYTGLMYLGREAMGADSVPVYAMPKMKGFLEENGPWSQLVKLNNIAIQPLQNSGEIKLTPNLKVMPFSVPHRDEYSETVGYTITGPNKKALFIPDIDKWEKWETDIIEAISKVDYAFIDGTFYDSEELNNRDMSEIPHPFVVESMEKFKDLPKAEKNKVYFIHFNHTNPLLNIDSKQYDTVIENGFHVAQYNDIFDL
jgi:pyrroloquinoline quinone biosynthesis protein B